MSKRFHNFGLTKEEIQRNIKDFEIIRIGKIDEDGLYNSPPNATKKITFIEKNYNINLNGTEYEYVYTNEDGPVYKNIKTRELMQFTDEILRDLNDLDRQLDFKKSAKKIFKKTKKSLKKSVKKTKKSKN